MKITLARHYGMCFGVRDALRTTHDLASGKAVTVLGELVHNAVVREHLRTLGVRDGSLEDLATAETEDVIVTAHGASETRRRAWVAAGYRVTDTTCPLVHRAHKALADLVARGYAPVVIGQPNHVEVRGLTGDFPDARVVAELADVADLPFAAKIGIVSQTTQPIAKVREIVAAIAAARPGAEVEFKDTVCQPTKDRQIALDELCAENEVVVVVGGHNSNNTHQLVETARKLGVTAYHVERPDELRPEWFRNVKTVGVTAGTSTLDESVMAVHDRLQQVASAQETAGVLTKMARAGFRAATT